MYIANSIDHRLAMIKPVTLDYTIVNGLTSILLNHGIGSTMNINANNFDSITNQMIQFLVSKGFDHNINFNAELSNNLAWNFKKDDVSATYLNKSDVSSILIKFPNIRNELIFRMLDNNMLYTIPVIFKQLLYIMFCGITIDNNTVFKNYINFIVDFKIDEHTSRSEWSNIANTDMYKYKLIPHLSYIPYTLNKMYEHMIHTMKSEFHDMLDWVLYDDEQIIFNYDANTFEPAHLTQLKNLLESDYKFNFNIYSGEVYVSDYHKYIWIPDADCASYISKISKGFKKTLV